MCPHLLPCSGDAALARIPLAEQLEMLNLWHQSLVTGLRAFKARFLSAQGSLLASADRELFQVGVEGVHYEGPLKLQVRQRQRNMLFVLLNVQQLVPF